MLKPSAASEPSGPSDSTSTASAGSLDDPTQPSQSQSPSSSQSQSRYSLRRRASKPPPAPAPPQKLSKKEKGGKEAAPAPTRLTRARSKGSAKQSSSSTSTAEEPSESSSAAGGGGGSGGGGGEEAETGACASGGCFAAHSAAVHPQPQQLANAMAGQEPPHPQDGEAGSGVGGGGGGGSGGEAEMGRLQQMLEARGLPSHILGALGPRIGGLLNRSPNTGPKVQGLLQGMSKDGDESAQLTAVMELCNLLVMGNEETLGSHFPVRDVVKALLKLMQLEHNFEIMIQAVRGISYLMEALPRSTPLVVEAIPQLIQRLDHIECMDVAEQALTALESLSKRHAKAVLMAGGIKACLAYLDFFSSVPQRTALSIAANCAAQVGQDELHLVLPSLPLLSNRLHSGDKKSAESVAAFFTRLVDNVAPTQPLALAQIADEGLITNVLNLLVVSPPAVSTGVFMSLLRMLHLLCAYNSLIAVQLHSAGIAETLRHLLVAKESGSGELELVPRSGQELHELVILIGELLPRLPTEGTSASLFAIQSLLRREPTATEAVGWSWKEDGGAWRPYSSIDSRILEAAFQAREAEVSLQAAGNTYTVDMESMVQINDDTGTSRAVQRRVTPLQAQAVAGGPRGAGVEKEDARLGMELEVMGAFIRGLFPVLYEVYAATAGPGIRHDCLGSMLRMVHHSSGDLLREVLKGLPISSHIANMLSSNDLRIVVGALQLVRCLLDKAPDVFTTYFRREGVVHQVQNLTKATPPSPATGGLGAKTSSEPLLPTAPDAAIPPPPFLVGSAPATANANPPMPFYGLLPTTPAPSAVAWSAELNLNEAMAAAAATPMEITTTTAPPPTSQPPPPPNQDQEMPDAKGPETTAAAAEDGGGSSGRGKARKDSARAKRARAERNNNDGAVANSSSSGSTNTKSSSAKALRKTASASASGSASSTSSMTTRSRARQTPPAPSQSAKAPPPPPPPPGTRRSNSSHEGTNKSPSSANTTTTKARAATTASAFLADKLSSLPLPRWARPSAGHSSQEGGVGGGGRGRGAEEGELGEHSHHHHHHHHHPASLQRQQSSSGAVNKEKVRAWIRDQASQLIHSFFAEEEAAESAVLGKLAKIAEDLGAGEVDLGTKPLEALVAAVLESDVSSFEILHSGIIPALHKYLTSPDPAPLAQAPAFAAPRSKRLKRFLRLFLGIQEEKEKGRRRVSLPTAASELPLSRLVAKLLSCLAQVEQFPVKVHEVPGSAAGGSLRGSSALRFFHTHQIKCILRRHPDASKQLKDWHRGPIKVDPLAQMSAIERYMLMKGYGRLRESTDAAAKEGGGGSSTDDGGSDDELEETLGLAGLATPHRIQFLIADRVLPYDITLFQAVRQFGGGGGETDGEGEGGGGSASMGYASVWVNTHTLYYRLAPGPSDKDDAKDESKAGKKVSPKDKAGKGSGGGGGKSPDLVWSDGKVPTRTSPLGDYLERRLLVCEEKPANEVAGLLRVLYGLNRHWWAVYRAEEQTMAAFRALIPTSEFVSPKLSQKVLRQAQDPLTVLSQQMPAWIRALAASAPFLLSFEARQAVFYSSALDRDRALQRLLDTSAEMSAANESVDGGQRVAPRLERRKVCIGREELLKQAEAVLNSMEGSQRAVLEVQYQNEEGTGLGPTLEFYALVSTELRKSRLGLWKDGRGVTAATAAGEADEDALVVNPAGLYPAPLSRVVKQAAVAKTRSKFAFVGRLLARALMDSRMLDLPLSPVLYKWLLGEEKSLGAAELWELDPTLSTSLHSLLLEPSSVEALELDFTLPGSDPLAELRKGGKDLPVTPSNVNDYVRLVTHWLVYEGVARQMEALVEGFDSVLPVHHLRLFYPEELEALFCGSQGAWDEATLAAHIRPDHGYGHDSEPVRWLVSIMASFDPPTRRAFLHFITGSPKLPVGGFKALSPPLTVVRKGTSDAEDADAHLPSVMTCVNYLKLPHYSSKDVMAARLATAIHWGQTSFHLS